MPKSLPKQRWMPAPEPFWEELQKQCRGDYDLACRVICLMRNTLFVVDEVRYHQVTDAIRRAKYEEAMRIIYGIEENNLSDRD